MRGATSLVAAPLLFASLAGCRSPAPTTAPTPRLDVTLGHAAALTDTIAPVWRYTVGIDPTLSTITTTFCLGGDPIPAGRLVPGEPECGRFLRGARLLKPGDEPRALPLSAAATGLDIPTIEAGTCVELTIDAGRAAEATGTHRIARRVGRDLVTSPDLWLYRPRQRGAPDIRLRFELPDGIEVSTAWPRTDDGVFEVSPTAWRWLNRVVFGRFKPLLVEVGPAQLEVVVLDGPRALVDDDVRRFVSRSAGAVSTAFGRFPRRRAQVTITPVSSFDPVPFGQVIRGGGPGVHLLLGSNATYADLGDDWVTVHEMSHLFTPFIKTGGRWLGEGIATYYQNVLRARAGLLSERDAWQKLLEGFERGATSGERGITLADAANDMWNGSNFLRVYWGGTAWALLGDVALRTRAVKPSSLDAALEGIASCCLDERRSYAALDLVDLLDEQVGGRTLRDLADQLLPATEFPEMGPTLVRLGIASRWGVLELRDEPRAAGLRRAIMRPAR